MKFFRVGEVGVGEMGQIIGETGVSEMGVGEMGVIPVLQFSVNVFLFVRFMIKAIVSSHM